MSLTIQQKLGISALPVSSDIIEFLFGKFKHIIERNPQADMNRTVLVIPVLCGQLEQTRLADILNRTHHADLKEWENENIPYTLRKNRQAFFDEIKSQKSGSAMAA